MPITPFPTLFTPPSYRPTTNTVELTVSNFFYENPKTGHASALEVWLGDIGPLQLRVYPVQAPGPLTNIAPFHGQGIVPPGADGAAQGILQQHPQGDASGSEASMSPVVQQQQPGQQQQQQSAHRTVQHGTAAASSADAPLARSLVRSRTYRSRTLMSPNPCSNSKGRPVLPFLSLSLLTLARCTL